MDQIKQEFLKKLSKFIVVSIWVLSLLISHNFYLYKLTIQLVTHAVDKKYMFLLCNGLLVFVAKYSGLMMTTSSKPIEESRRWSKTNKAFDYGDLESYDAILELEYDSVHETEPFLDVEVNETTKDYEDGANDEETEEKEEEEYDNDDDDDDDETLTNNGEQEEGFDLRGGLREEEEDSNVGVITEEDMNKKFDEFIRKMKEELRIEAKRQLILV